MNENPIPTFFRSPNSIKKDHDFVIFAVPYDGESTQHRGFTLNASNEIRTLSDDIALVSEDGFDLNEIKMADLGNINEFLKIDVQKLNELSPFELNNYVSEYITKIYQKKSTIIPVTIGGNHYTSFPVFSAIREHYKNENIYYISFDAHLDFYDDWNFEKNSHCTVTKRVFELNNMGSEHVLVAGVRDIDIPELELAQMTNLKYFTVQQTYELSNQKPPNEKWDFMHYFKNFIEREISLIKNTPKRRTKIYVTIDIDVLDPSVAPATGYPIPGGINYRDLHQALSYLSKHFQIIGFDLVEYAPNLDLKNKMTGFLCAKLISEFLILITKNQLHS